MKDIVTQTRNAFNFVQKLYFETSYLIKEVEGLLQQEPEEFVILRPAGYHVTARHSTGLESYSVENWLLKNLTVFFCPDANTERKGGQTITKPEKDLKLIVVHINLFDKNIESPILIYGIIQGIKNKKQSMVKFENLVSEFSYHYEKIFAEMGASPFENVYFAFTRIFKKMNLYEITNSSDIDEKIIQPVLQMFRKK